MGLSIVRSSQALSIDGVKVQCGAKNVDGYNYFKLAALKNYLGYGPDYDEASRTI